VGRWGWGLTDFLTGSGWGNKNKDATYSTVVCIFFSQVDSSGGSGFEKGNKKNNNKRNNKGLLLHLTLNFLLL